MPKRKERYPQQDFQKQGPAENEEDENHSQLEKARES